MIYETRSTHTACHRPMAPHPTSGVDCPHARNEINKSGKAIARELAEAKQNGAMTGWPDLIVLPPSHVGPIFFEVKAEGNYPTDAQKRVHDQLRGLGYRVGIVRSVDDVKQRLADWGIWFNRGAA